jgi:rare lipoprotein A
MKRAFALMLFILFALPHNIAGRGEVEQGFATYNRKEPGLKASHAYLALDTRVRITNQANGRAVIVTINGRIPRDTGRTVHVGRLAAENIGLDFRAKSPVTVEVLGRPRYSSRR